MAQPLALIWDLLVKDQASGGFLRVAGAADKAAASTTKAQAALAGASAKMATVGAKMTKSVTLPLLGIAAVSVNMAAKFQQSTNVLVTAAGESEKNLKMVRKGILDIAATTGTSWKEVTDGMYQLEKAGYRGADALKVEKAAAQGAREEGASLNTVTAAMTSIMASYHLKASDAVRVMNQMKTAAGESKTTMEQFAGSLSTVLPLASANKISFADIAGSLASLTQHGTSADEAAQELAFTMRGLAAPNMVAQKMMSQLGISSVDVATKLGDGPGGRGLAGTLNYLSETVLHKMGPSGLVLLNTFNQSKQAAADARTEFAALDPFTQKLAKGFLDGSISAGDWRKSVSNLTPEQAALARQFAVTSNNARGFQQALRNGTSGSLTYSDAIKKMTGGANGLNTVLQLTGESMDGTNHRIKAIADSALGAGKNVSGWASTQKLAAVQFDVFKQSMARMAIEIGTALLPALTAIVEKISGLVQWFQDLGSGTKKFIGITLLVGAALGPLISLVAKLTRGFVLLFAVGVGASRLVAGIAGVELALGAMGSRSYTAGLAIRRMGTQGITAARGMGAALAGAGIGVSLGMMTRNSGTAAKAMSALASTALGAAAGFAAGGPIGAAIGGGVGLLSNLATAFFGAGDAAKKSVQPTDDYTSAIQRDSDAVGNNTKLLVASNLQKRGLYDIGLKMGIQQKTLLAASLGDAHARQLVNIALEAHTPLLKSTYGLSDKAAAAQNNMADASKKLRDGLGLVNDELKVNTRAATNIDSALGKATKTTSGLTNASGAAASKFNVLAGSSSYTTTTLINLFEAGRLTTAQLNALVRSKRVNLNTQGAGLALAALRIKMADYDKQHPSVTVTADTSSAMAAFQQLANAIPSGTYHINLAADAAKRYAGTHAMGGYITGRGTGTSDSIPARLSNGEFVVRAAATARNLPLLHAINSGRGYANGGQVKTSMVPSYASLNRPGMGSGSAGDPATGLLASIDRKLDQLAHLRQVGPDVADALNGAARTAAHQRQTVPAGRNW